MQKSAHPLLKLICVLGRSLVDLEVDAAMSLLVCLEDKALLTPGWVKAPAGHMNFLDQMGFVQQVRT